MAVSENGGTPKSSILIGFSIIFTIHFGVPLFLETPILEKNAFRKKTVLFRMWFLEGRSCEKVRLWRPWRL